jgi:hypothetical protein
MFDGVAGVNGYDGVCICRLPIYVYLKSVYISVNCYVQEVYTASHFLLFGEVKFWCDVIKAVEEVLCVCLPLILYYEKVVYVTEVSHDIEV